MADTIPSDVLRAWAHVSDPISISVRDLNKMARALLAADALADACIQKPGAGYANYATCEVCWMVGDTPKTIEHEHDCDLAAYRTARGQS